jgi:hypothetical protein
MLAPSDQPRSGQNEIVGSAQGGEQQMPPWINAARNVMVNMNENLDRWRSQQRGHDEMVGSAHGDEDQESPPFFVSAVQNTLNSNAPGFIHQIANMVSKFTEPLEVPA